MQWFRMYVEFAYDAKVQVLTEALQRRYVMALCLHCDNKLENRPDDEIALSLRVTLEEWISTKLEFQKRGLLNDSGIPNGWEKRQYISDIKDPTSALRQKRYRDNKRNNRNATVTSRLPDSDTDTDKDIKDNTKVLSKKIGLDELSVEHISEWLAKKRGMGKYLNHDEYFILEQFKQYCQAKGKRYADFTAGYRNAFEWDKCQPKLTSSGIKPNKDDRAKAAIMRGLGLN